MSLRFDLEHRADEELGRLVKERLFRALAELDHLDGPAQRRATAVHNARKRLKECRALLRLVRGQKLCGKSVSHFNRRLRDLGLVLSGQRDSDAMLEVTERMIAEADSDSAQSQSHRAVLQQLQGVLESQRAATLAAAVISSDDGFALRVELLSLADQVSTASERFEYRLFIDSAVRTYAIALRSMQRVREFPSIEHTHEMRKRMKDHWYQVRLLEQLDPNKLTLRKKKLKQLTETLGDYQDMSVLRSWLVGQEKPPLPAPELAQLMSLLGQRSWRLQQHALQQAEPLFKHSADYWSRRWLGRLREVS